MPTLTESDHAALLLRRPDLWSQEVSEGRFTPYSYQSLMMREVAAAVRTGGGRIIINVPSRHGKSTAVSHWLPTWFLERWPHKRVILASYGQNLASHWGRKVRNEFHQNPRLHTKLSDDSQAVDCWNTPEDGGMVAVGVSGPVMGKGGDLIVTDDPHKDWEEAHSFVIREKTIEWFTSTLFSRQEPGATIVVIQQRLDEEDLSGWLIEKHPDPWKVIRLPALAEAGDPLGRAEGEALCPDRYTSDALHIIRRGMDAAAWEAMFQQRPQAIGGGRLYHAFAQADHVDSSLVLQKHLPLQLSFDFNRNPGSHIEIGQYDPFRDLFTVTHEIHGSYMKLDAALDATTAVVRGLGGWQWPGLDIFGDATGTQERAETTQTCYQMIASWVRKMGWPARFKVPAANPPVRSRLDALNTALRDADGEIHYTVHPRCVRLIADLKEMKADEQGLEDKRDSKLSHASSAEGYRVHYLRPTVRIKPKNAVPVMM